MINVKRVLGTIVALACLAACAAPMQGARASSPSHHCWSNADCGRSTSCEMWTTDGHRDGICRPDR